MSLYLIFFLRYFVKTKLTIYVILYILIQNDIIKINVTFRSIRYLGGCPRIAIFPKIEAYEKNYRRHIVDIPKMIF